jgi:hypothetical protein
MSHFTYADSADFNCLRQGDVLKKTDNLLKVIEEVHPYFKSATFTHFLVLTQSCDLIKRDGVCNSRYITIAAIRPLEDAIKRKVKEVSSTELERISNTFICERTYAKLKDFLQSLLNNNINDYFYLHPEPSFNLIDQSVAFLRVSIALKSELHYDTCLSCKIMELNDNFKSKLGWLVGNLYSRVGTEDWVPKTMRIEPFTKFVNDLISSYFIKIPNLPDVEKKLLETNTLDELKRMEVNRLKTLIKDCHIESKKEKALSRIGEIINENNCLKEEFTLNRLINIMRNDPSLSIIIK